MGNLGGTMKRIWGNMVGIRGGDTKGIWGEYEGNLGEYERNMVVFNGLSFSILKHESAAFGIKMASKKKTCTLEVLSRIGARLCRLQRSKSH